MKRSASGAILPRAMTIAPPCSHRNPCGVKARAPRVETADSAARGISYRTGVHTTSPTFGHFFQSKKRAPASVNSDAVDPAQKTKTAEVQVSVPISEAICATEALGNKMFEVSGSSNTLSKFTIIQENQPQNEKLSPGRRVGSPHKKFLDALAVGFNKPAFVRNVVQMSPVTGVSSLASSPVQRRRSIKLLPQSRLYRSPGPLVSQKRGVATTPGSIVTSPENRNVQSIRNRLQETLGQKTSKPVVNSRLTLYGPQTVSEVACAVIEASEITMMASQAISDSLQQPQLKDILQNPDSVGSQFTVAQFRRMESTKLHDNHSPKSCLRIPTYSRQSSLKEELLQSSDHSKPTLKKSVSFSENVVMFMYQA